MKNRVKFTAIMLGFQMAFACTPEDVTYPDNETIDISRVDSVSIVPNHFMVLADGRAQLDLYPRLYTKEGDLIPGTRVKEEMLEYTLTSGTTISRYFSTSDVSLTGQTLTVRMKLKGADVVSEPVSFRIVAPLAEKYTSEIVIPVVFHIIQTTEDITSYGGAYKADRIAMQLKKINHLFAGVSSVNPVGVNAHVRFELAKYDPNGIEMTEPGINRYTADRIDLENYKNFLKEGHFVWPADRYMNIWLLSDRKGEIGDFANEVSEFCTPHYVYAGTSSENRPEGIDWEEFTEGNEFQLEESGIVYKLQELDNPERSMNNSSSNKFGNNELAYYIGRYFGLLPTCTRSETEIGTDYCEDTHDYCAILYSSTGTNIDWYKEAGDYYFLAENIMDDPWALHVSVSKNQCERMRWVLENCPERAAWKSQFAFNGK